MGVLALAAGSVGTVEHSGDGLNEAGDAGRQQLDSGGEETRDDLDHDENPFVRYVMKQDILPC